MKTVKDGDGFLSVGRRVEREQGDAGWPRVGRLQNRSGIELAVGDAKLGVAAQGAGEQLGLHAVGVCDQHGNRLGSGGGQLHVSPDVREQVMSLILGSGSAVHKEMDHKMWSALSKWEWKPRCAAGLDGSTEDVEMREEIFTAGAGWRWLCGRRPEFFSGREADGRAMEFSAVT